jgi:hypothetical protein
MAAKATKAAENGPVAVRSRVAGEARLSIQIVDRRYNAQKVVEGLNAGELQYASGLILGVDDRMENFRLAG